VPCEHAFSDAGLTDTKHHSCLLPENFGSIQIVKNRLKRDRRQHKGVIATGEAEQRQRLLDDAECKVAAQTQAASVIIVDL